MKVEIVTLEKNKTCELVDLPKEKKILLDIGGIHG